MVTAEATKVCNKCNNSSLYVDRSEDTINCFTCGKVFYNNLIGLEDHLPSFEIKDERTYEEKKVFNKRKRTSEIRNKIIDLFNDGKTREEVMHELGVNIWLMRYHLNRFKLQGMSWPQVPYDKRRKK